jgi:hypothetical protein
MIQTWGLALSINLSMSCFGLLELPPDAFFFLVNQKNSTKNFNKEIRENTRGVGWGNM